MIDSVPPLRQVIPARPIVTSTSPHTVITHATSLHGVEASDALLLEVQGSGAALFAYVEFRESLYGLALDIQQ